MNKFLNCFSGNIRSDYIQDQILRGYGLITAETNDEGCDYNSYDNNNEIITRDNEVIHVASGIDSECDIQIFESQVIPNDKNAESEEKMKKVKFGNVPIQESIGTNLPLQTSSFQIEAIIEIINEFDNYRNQISNPDTVQIVELMQTRLLSVIVEFGGKLINGEDSFDNNRHVACPLTVIEDGTPIKSTIRSGIFVGNTIFLKAIVEV